MSVVASTTRSRAAYRSSPSTPAPRPMVAKISPTSPRGSMPSPTSSLSLGVPIVPDGRDQLADDRDHEEDRRITQHGELPELRRRRHRCRSARKNTGMRRWPTGASSRRIRARLPRTSEREARREGADDNGQLRSVGQLREGEGERERDGDDGAGRLRPPFDDVEQAGRDPQRRPCRRPRGTRWRRPRSSRRRSPRRCLR